MFLESPQFEALRKAKPTRAPSPTQPGQLPAPTPTAVQPTPYPEVSKAVQQWRQIKPRMGSLLLEALNKVWYQGGTLTRQEETWLRGLYQDFPFGASTFDVWLKQILRQIQEKAAIEEGALLAPTR